MITVLYWLPINLVCNTFTIITGDLDQTSTFTIAGMLHVVNTITITGIIATTSTITITINQRDLCYNLLLL